MVSYGYKGRIYGSIAETQFLHFFDIFGSEKQQTRTVSTLRLRWRAESSLEFWRILEN